MRAGIIGLGYAGQVHHRELSRIGGVEIASICDSRADHAKRLAAEWKIPSSHASLREMLEVNLDLVCICTPPGTHATLAIEAIEAGVNVIIEKPFTETLGDALAILEASGSSEAKVGVVHNMLFARKLREAKVLFDRGNIGDLLNITVVRATSFEHDIFISDRNHWCHDMPGGRVSEALPHQVYLAQEFLPAFDPGEIKARKLGDQLWVSFDEVLIPLESEESYGSIYWSRNTTIDDYRVLLIGTRGSLDVGLADESIAKMSGRIGGNDSLRQIRYSTAKALQLISSVVGRVGRAAIRTNTRPHEDCLRSLVGSISRDEKPYVDARKGYENIRVMERIFRDLESLTGHR